MNWTREGDRKAVTLCESKFLRPCDEQVTMGFPCFLE